MPGYDPNEAVKEFLTPLEEAVAVLAGYSKLAISGAKQGYRTGKVYMWSLNESEGMTLRNVGLFSAQMHFEVIECDPDKYGKPYRVTTRGYSYSLESLGTRETKRATLWRMDWHPNGRSPVDYPHLHLPPDTDLHQPLPRLTFEKAVEWCIHWGAELCCTKEEALQILLLSETNHRLHRTWNERPGEPVG